MRKLTKQEEETLDKLYGIPILQLFTLVMWDIFYPVKRDKLLDGLIAGKSWKFAYKDAKI